MLEIKGKYTTAKIMIDNVEEQCLNQIYNMVNNIAFTEPISIMVDAHAGKSAVIGFTMPLSEKVIPAVIGVDIGCGMISANIGEHDFKTKILEGLDRDIRKVIPMGSNIHQKSMISSNKFKNEFPWNEVNELVKSFILKYNEKFNTNYKPIEYTYEWFINKCKEIGIRQNAELAIGTLGGGNHFIEIGKSESNEIYITVHSGSRNFGKMICDYHQGIAKDILSEKRNIILNDKIKEIKENFIGKEIDKQIKKVKKDLGIDFEINMNGMEYIEGQYAMDYFYDMIFAQKYAEFNRKEMINRIIEVMGVGVKETINSVHNFINFDDLIIRKGAISSYEGQKMIIPFNMRDGLLICEGKSNKEWNYSAPHGAGRVMSRGFASKNVDIDEFKESMKGIVSSSVCKGTLDESPMAYKNSKMIEELIEPTATILDRVKPILNIKDKGDRVQYKKKEKEYEVIDKRKDRLISKERDLKRKVMRKNKGIY